MIENLSQLSRILLNHTEFYRRMSTFFKKSSYTSNSKEFLVRGGWTRGRVIHFGRYFRKEEGITGRVFCGVL